ncbi:MAG: helix-turn-helix transcriptional regulator, partial [Eubacteriales bacterium]
PFLMRRSIRSSAHKEWGVDVRYRQNRIKMLRRARGITVKRLAVLVGVSQSMLTNYENGSSIPRDQEVWDRLAVYFGVSVPYLMGF